MTPSWTPTSPTSCAAQYFNTSNRPPSPGSERHIFVSPHLLTRTVDYRGRNINSQTSDHRIVSVCMYQPEPPQSKEEKNRLRERTKAQAPALDTRILKDPEFIHSIKDFIQKEQDTREALESPPPIGEHWDRLKETFLQMGQEFANKKTRQRRRDEINLTHRIKKATVALDNNPNDPAAHQELEEARQELRAIDQTRFDHIKILAKVKSVEENERASPTFTARLKTKTNNRTILALKDARGTTQSGQKEMRDVAKTFYSNLSLLNTTPTRLGPVLHRTPS